MEVCNTHFFDLGTFLKYTQIGLNIFILNQFIQYNTIVNHTNIRITHRLKAEPQAHLCGEFHFVTPRISEIAPVGNLGSGSEK